MSNEVAVFPETFREEAYLEPISQVAPRIMLAVGAAWGACFFALMAVLDPSNLGALLTFSAAGGAAFGLVWGNWFSWYVKRFHRHLLESPSEYFTYPAEIQEEVPALEILGNQRVGRVFVGGKVVLTGSALWFLPHNRNAHAFRGPTRIPVADITDLELLPRGTIERWLTGPRSDLFPGRMRLTTPDAIHEFNVGTREMVASLVALLTARMPSARQVDVAVESGSLLLAMQTA